MLIATGVYCYHLVLALTATVTFIVDVLIATHLTSAALGCQILRILRCFLSMEKNLRNSNKDVPRPQGLVLQVTHVKQLRI